MMEVQSNEPSSERPAEATDEGVLTGTAAERSPGVGGQGDHPAPAAVRDPDTGGIHVAGEPPAGTIASSVAPAGDSTDLQSGDVTNDAALARLDEVVDHEPYPTERPDIGTE